MPKAKPLYGHMVCKKCYYGFANRRQGAFVIDSIGIRIVGGFAGVMLGSLLIGTIRDPSVVQSLLLLFDVLLIALFLCKDGIAGQSPGKLVCGVRAMDVRTGKPIGFGASFKRNLPLVIPFMPLIVAAQLCKGHRTGDGWAHSRVVWNRYADHPIFTGGNVPTTEQYDPALLDALAAVPDDGNPYRSPLT